MFIIRVSILLSSVLAKLPRIRQPSGSLFERVKLLVLLKMVLSETFLIISRRIRIRAAVYIFEWRVLLRVND